MGGKGSGGHRKGSGRKKGRKILKYPRLKRVSMSIPIWINDWLDSQNSIKVKLVVDAIIGFYGLKKPKG